MVHRKNVSENTLTKVSTKILREKHKYIKHINFINQYFQTIFDCEVILVLKMYSKIM